MGDPSFPFSPETPDTQAMFTVSPSSNSSSHLQIANWFKKTEHIVVMGKKPHALN